MNSENIENMNKIVKLMSEKTIAALEKEKETKISRKTLKMVSITRKLFSTVPMLIK